MTSTYTPTPVPTEVLFGPVDVAAKRFGLSTRTIWRLIAAGKISAGRAGKRRLVEFSSIERMIRDSQ